MLPMTVVHRDRYVQDGTSGVSKTTRLKVKSYKVADASNAPQQYRCRWPKGAQVLDDRIGLMIEVSTDGRVLDDAAIHAALKGRSELEAKRLEQVQRVLDEALSDSPVSAQGGGELERKSEK